MCVYIYLCEGTGNPWAGQKSVRSWPTTRSYQDFFASLENFGFFEATGSVTRISEERGLRNCFYRINGVSGYATETRYTERFASIPTGR